MKPGERHVTAGPLALAAMSKLLGLTAGQGWALEGLCALGQEELKLRLSLSGAGRRLVFFILPAGAAEGQVRAAGLSLAAEGRPGPAVLRFLKKAAARLGKTTPAGAARLLERDPRSFVEEVVAGQPERVAVPCVGQPIGLLETGWRNFFADQDFEVLLGVPDCSSNKTVNVEYADLECYYARPQRDFNKWTFLDWPEESEGGAAGSDLRDGESNIVAELDERDMVMGTGERADALVAEVRKRAAAGDFLVFTHLCTPIVMGEDLQGLARRCEDEVGGGANSVRWSQKDRDGNDNFGEHFRALLGRPGFFDGPGDALAVNLFHFPKACREAEVRPFLDGLGLKTNIAVFPDIDLTHLEALPAARWQVFCQHSAYPTKVRELLAAGPRPVVTVPAPYGVAGTRACLSAIAAAAGLSGAFDAAWAARMADFMPSWEKLREEAAGFRLAFVVSQATLPRLLELRYGHGAPLAVMAAEMGFGLDLLYYDIHGEAPRLPDALKSARVSVFRAPWELERALAGGDFQAVFSDMFFDRRIVQAGKARFSSKDFEMGLEGARRTCERLLSVCRLPFFRRYAAHLAGPRPAP
ncbi:MAG: nitrogenase component 1 [Elusimicrobiota bacterium]